MHSELYTPVIQVTAHNTNIALLAIDDTLLTIEFETPGVGKKK